MYVMDTGTYCGNKIADPFRDHENYHDGKSERDVVSALHDDHSQTDGGTQNPAQLTRCSNQGKLTHVQLLSKSRSTCD